MRSGADYPLFRPGDILLLLLIALLAFSFSRSAGDRSSPATAVLTGPGLEAELQLDRDTLVTVEGRIGFLTVEVLDGRARITSSPCPGQDCVRRGWVCESGDVSVCIPSGVMLRLDPGDRPGDGVDALTY